MASFWLVGSTVYLYRIRMMWFCVFILFQHEALVLQRMDEAQRQGLAIINIGTNGFLVGKSKETHYEAEQICKGFGATLPRLDNAYDKMRLSKVI